MCSPAAAFMHLSTATYIASLSRAPSVSLAEQEDARTGTDSKCLRRW